MLLSCIRSCQGDVLRAEQLRVSGQSLTGCGQYALDCVQPKCAELERICTEFTAHFNYRLSRLHDAQQMWRAVLHVRIQQHVVTLFVTQAKQVLFFTGLYRSVFLRKTRG